MTPEMEIVLAEPELTSNTTVSFGEGVLPVGPPDVVEN
jgi:hypothetical protein